MSEIYFENSVGRTVRLDRGAIRIKDALSLREFEWSYTASEYPMQFGAKISKFTRGAAAKPISVVVRGKTRQECLSALNELLVCETDISANKPGKLWLDGQYLKCYLGTSSEIEEWAGGFHFMEKNSRFFLRFRSGSRRKCSGFELEREQFRHTAKIRGTIPISVRHGIRERDPFQ
ncbi:MAG: hypothetical protein ACLTV6_07985 [Christensenellales bacterium]